MQLPEKRTATWFEAISGQKRIVLGAVLLCGLTLLAFRGLVQNGFINYDDPDYVTANPHVLGGLTWANVVWAFTTTRVSNWNPLTWLSHMLDVELFGVNPQGHHLMGLVLHTTNALILFWLLRGMSGAFWRSFFVAAFFALHPLHVESVAWASERKDLLSTFFFLLTIWAYARYVREWSPVRSPECRVGNVADGKEPPNDASALSKKLSYMAPAEIPSPPLEERVRERRLFVSKFFRHGTRPGAVRFYLLSLALYACGLMSKPMLVTVPFVLLLVDFWPLARVDLNAGKERARDLFLLVLEKVPFLVLAAVSSLITVLSQASDYSMFGGLPLRVRVATAVVTYLEYLRKTIWPSDLAVFYPDPNARYFAPPHTTLYPASELWPAWQLIAAVLLLVTVCALVWLRRKREPWLVTSWFWFLGVLVPVIGIVQAGAQVMADRYTYIPLIGIFIACVWTATDVARRYQAGHVVAGCGGALLLAACVLVTQRQVGYWRNDRTLFEHALAVTSRNPMAEWMVGASYAERGQLGLAQTHFRLALAADPYAVEPHLMLGSLYEMEGRTDLATNEYRTALRKKPQEEFARVHLAGLLRKLGQAREALAEYEAALRWNPDSVEANYQAGTLLLEAGDLKRAERFLGTALRLQPNHADALLCVSDLRTQQGRPAEALAALAEVVRLYPTNFELRVNLGGMLWKGGLREEAVAQYREAVRLNPSHPMGHYDLGTTLLALGNPAAATGELGEAVRLK
ncbi:MAG TPA: tetratricopeptide repeat protein, partial [Verrucomicrobiae bacterium]